MRERGRFITLAMAGFFYLYSRVAIDPTPNFATLFLQDETFIKLKPTIIYVLFGVTLLGGHLFNKPLLAMVFDSVFHLKDEGWRKLTLRWAFFFLALAVLNEIIWRTQTTDTWVAFKVFGFLPITLLFAGLQVPLLQKYAAPEGAKE